jgi:hypothetical protein
MGGVGMYWEGGFLANRGFDAVNEIVVVVQGDCE